LVTTYSKLNSYWLHCIWKWVKISSVRWSFGAQRGFTKKVLTFILQIISLKYKIITVVSKHSLAQTKRDFYCVWMHRFIAVKVLQRLHAVGFLALSVVTVPDYGRHHFLTMWVFVTGLQRLVTCTLEVQNWIVDWRWFRTYIYIRQK